MRLVSNGKMKHARGHGFPARRVCAVVAALLCAGLNAWGQSPPPESAPVGAGFQTTYIWQSKPAFRAAYSGVNSLSAAREKSYSFTGTAFLGARLGTGTELYFNPELVQGVPMSGLTGLGGLSNGELQKTAGPNPLLYRARLFLRQTWGKGGEREQVEADLNQLAGTRDKNRVVLTAGNLAASDIFDNNAYAHDARTQFMNWSFLTHGAYDFAADARGYSWGAALEYIQDGWALRAGRFAQPKSSNGLALDFRLFTHYGDQIELEKSYSLAGQPGKARLLAFRNVSVMGGFRDALADGTANAIAPDVGRVRTLRSKRGWGLAVEQALTSDLGVFGRYAANDGRSEAYAFAEIDQSLSAGAILSGAAWGRAQDAVGVAYARNGLSDAHRDYLAAGGNGFFVGDGKLTYRPESTLEMYYSWAIPSPWTRRSAISLGHQYIRNPAYNADRGPVHVTSVRLHAEF